MLSLDLARRADELRIMVDDLLARTEPATDEEIDQLSRLRRELQATLVQLTSAERAARPDIESVDDAEDAVALGRSTEALAEAMDRGRRLEATDDDPSRVTEDEATAGRSTADEIQAGIDRLEREADVADSPGLRRARQILIRLLAMQVEYNIAFLGPAVERMEADPEPPSGEELEALRPAVDQLRDTLDDLEQDLVDDQIEPAPPALVSGVDVIRRFANLDLASALRDLTPFVEACESQEGPLTPEQIEELREIPGQLRPKMRSARRTTVRRVFEGTHHEPCHAPRHRRTALRRGCTT
jgi:hypothetical protein